MGVAQKLVQQEDGFTAFDPALAFRCDESVGDFRREQVGGDEGVDSIGEFVQQADWRVPSPPRVRRLSRPPMNRLHNHWLGRSLADQFDGDVLLAEKAPVSPSRMRFMRSRARRAFSGRGCP